MNSYYIYNIELDNFRIILEQEELDNFVSSSSATLFPPSTPFIRITSTGNSIVILDNVFTEIEALEILNDAYRYHVKNIHNKVLESLNLLR